MTDDLAISVASNYEFEPKVPPGYEDGHSGSEDSISPPSSPTTYPVNDLNGDQRAIEDDVDGGGEHDDGKLVRRSECDDVCIVNGILNGGNDNQIHSKLVLPKDDVVKDGAGERNSLPVERKMGVAEKGVQEEKNGVIQDEPDGGGRGKKGDMGENEIGLPPVKSKGHLNKSKQKALTIQARDVSEENVHEFIDDMEEAIAAVSKGEEGAGNRLGGIVKGFLPHVLCIVSEVTTLRGKVKDFILENRSLQKRVRQLKKEIEERNARDEDSEHQDETKPGKTVRPTSTVQQSPDVKRKANHVTTAEVQKQAPDGGDDEKVQKELKKLRSQNKELQRVNHSWEKYSKKLSTKHEIEMKKKTAQLAASDERRKELERRLDDKFKEYDQTLLHARHSEAQHRAAAEQYKKDRDVLRKKYDEMTTQLRDWIKEREDKDKEIQRLNQVVERQAAQKPRIKTGVDEELGCAGHAKPAKKVPIEMLNGAGPILYVNLGKDVRKTRKEKQPSESTTRPRSPPSSPPRSPQEEGSPMTLGKEELKDQVELYRQQIDVFRADFIQERHDREKAIGQVDSLKKELEKTRKKLEEMQRDRFEHDLLELGQDYIPRRAREEAHQKMRGGRNTGYGRQYAFQDFTDLPEKMRGGRNTGYGRQYAFQDFTDLPENHVYSVIED